MELLPPSTLTHWLHAAADPSRLRLLALCTDGALSVSELAASLRQSEPRTSRHLKILCDAGLLERLRQGQRVHYRMSANAAGANFVRAVLAMLDRTDPTLAQDRAGARALSGSVARPGSESRLGRTLAGLVLADAPRLPAGPLLLLGVQHPELLVAVARVSGGCTAIAQSRRSAQWSRAFAERNSLACQVIEAAAAAGFSDADLARSGGPFAGIVLDQPSGGAAALPLLLGRARAALIPGGRLWFFERYDSLDSVADRIVEHPLARLRRLLSDAGIKCEKITPVEAEGEHFLAASGLAAPAAAGAHGVTGAA